jgi:hypothetical protein
MSAIATRIYYNTAIPAYLVFLDATGDDDSVPPVAKFPSIDATGAWHRERGGDLGPVRRDTQGRSYRSAVYLDPLPLDCLPILGSYTVALVSVPAAQSEWEALLAAAGASSEGFA